MRWFFCMVGLVLVLSWPVPALAAAPRSRCFVQTGYCISDPMLAYWDHHGGLAVFGYPISDVIPNETVEQTWVGATQWFERDRLEDHGRDGIMAGRLGALTLARQGRPWVYGPGWSDVGCRYFPETGYTLCGGFLRYWESNGGLERFGYPLTTELTETINGWHGQVQYFERRRLEYHPEFAGTPYDVLLGRLAADAYAQSPPVRCTPVMTADAPIQHLAASVSFADRLGCPTRYDIISAVAQTFATGQMIWLNYQALGEANNVIMATYVSSVEEHQPTAYANYFDDWQVGVDPDTYLAGVAPYYPIMRGFGKVWFRAFRRGPIQIAPAVTAERPQMAIVQRYSSGAVIVKLIDDHSVYAYGPSRLDVATYLYDR
jgi:hypothetical protein